MQHFGQLAAPEQQRLFHRTPSTFTRDEDRDTLAVGLGATLYCPATRQTLAEDVRKQAERGVTSMVLCLEDAIGDDEVPDAEENLVQQLHELLGAEAAQSPAGADSSPQETPEPDDAPMVFIRVRSPEQLYDVTKRLGPAASRLSGFVLPKFTEETGRPFLEAMAEAETLGTTDRLLAMPVLESPELIHQEVREATLRGIAEVLHNHRDRILALRLGVTDLCSAYGLRRSPDLTAYDIQLVAGVITDVVNLLGRADGTGFTITGPVWEYFPMAERMFKPQLRRSPFAGVGHGADELRTSMIRHSLDGLVREIELDRVNGLLGKTCIHPSHVGPVHALSVVTHEEWSDAVDILGPEQHGGGVMRSVYTNKMNEVKPHRAWAEHTMRRARLFGVAREDVTFVDLLGAFAPETIQGETSG